MILTPCIASIDDAAVIVDINVIGNDLVGNIVLQKFGVDSYDVVTRMSPTGNIEDHTDQRWHPVFSLNAALLCKPIDRLLRHASLHPRYGIG